MSCVYDATTADAYLRGRNLHEADVAAEPSPAIRAVFPAGVPLVGGAAEALPFAPTTACSARHP